MIGVAVGLGNVWRFPYMVGRFGGAAFVLFYALVVVTIGVPALVAETALGRATRLGTVGAFARAGLPGGRGFGWFLFAAVTAATAYYTAVIGWVLCYAVGQVAAGLGQSWDAAAVLPPASGFSIRSFVLQAACTAAVILSCAVVLVRGVRRGIESVSRLITPTLFIVLVALVIRAVTLPGAGAGLRWYLLKLQPSELRPSVMLAAMGQAVFSLSLGGTFMVVYGSYLRDEDDLRRNALWTAAGDTIAGLLAGLAIFPAVFAFGLKPGGGPGLIFSTLPHVFATMPAGAIFGFLFFATLFGAAYLSDIGAFEVLVAGLTDNTGLERRRAVWLMAGIVFLCALPPSVNMHVFVPWDLTFGSGMQTLGAFAAVVTVGWAMKRGKRLATQRAEGAVVTPSWLYWWIRWVVPIAILAVGAWWLATDVLHLGGSA